MAAMVATMATKKETSWRPGPLVAVVTPAVPLPAAWLAASTRPAISYKDRKNNRVDAGLGSGAEEGGSQLAPGVERQAARIGRQHLDADVIRTGGVMGPHSLPDRVEPAPGHDRVDEAVASPVGQVIVGEAEREQVVPVVWQAEIDRHVPARDGAGSRRVLLQHGGLLRCEERARAHDLPRARGVLRGNEVGMSAAGSLPRECEHLRRERPDDPLGRAGRGDGQEGRRLHRVEVAAHEAERLLVAVPAHAL